MTDRAKLTRRDRAAMALALEVLRGGELSLNSAIDATRFSDGWTYDAGYAVHCELIAARAAAPSFGDLRTTMRLLRARLALYLRAVLRADVGDVFSEPCKPCEYNGRESRAVVDVRRRAVAGGRPAVMMRCDRCGDFYFRSDPLRITPLWERAPRHEP